MSDYGIWDWSDGKVVCYDWEATYSEDKKDDKDNRTNGGKLI